MASTPSTPDRSAPNNPPKHVKIERNTAGLFRFHIAVLFAVLLFGVWQAFRYRHLVLTPFTVTADKEAAFDRALLAAYDPLTNKQLLNARLAYTCKPDIPTLSELKVHPYREKWSISRFAAYHNINLYLQELWKGRTESDDKLKVLDASGSVFLKPHQHLLEITKTEYPKVDLHRTPYETGYFDVVAADQVLEHTFFPQMIFLEMHRLLKPGGIGIVTTIAYNPLHESSSFHDMYRFMLDGLKVLSMPFEGGIEICGSWGHKDAIKARVEHGMGDPEEVKIFKTGFDRMSATNDLINPFLVWIIVKK